MRRVLGSAALLLVLATGCSRLAQQQDTLAPRAASPDAPVQLDSSANPSAASPNAAASPNVQVPPAAPGPACAGSACAANLAQPAASVAGQPASAGAAARPSGSAQSSPSAAAGPSASGQANASAPGSGQAAGSTGQASAQATASGRPGASSQAAQTAAPVTVAPTASRALLQPMQHEYETWNNCAPVTAEMVLSYYGIFKKQTEIAPVLRPHPKNFSVRMDQIGAYLQTFGLEGQPLVGGSIPLLKALVSNNIPVVVEDQLSLQEDYGHFRVVRGFDDGAGVLIFGDSYYGPTNRLTYSLYQELWKRHNFGFMPVYKPAQRPLVQAIMGRDFDANQNQLDALAEAKQAVAAKPDDGFAWLNMGEDLYATGDLQDAKTAWEQAKKRQLTGRTLWYTIWPAAVYNQLGDFQQALEVVAQPLATDPYNALALLERGNAYKGLGQKDRARADYSLAFEVDPSLLPAKLALQNLG